MEPNFKLCLPCNGCISEITIQFFFFLSLTWAAQLAFPTYALFRAQPEIWAEFIHRIWGSPLRLSPFQDVPLCCPAVVFPLNSVLWFFKPIHLSLCTGVLATPSRPCPQTESLKMEKLTQCNFPLPTVDPISTCF